MGVISIVIGIKNQLITGGAPPCMEPHPYPRHSPSMEPQGWRENLPWGESAADARGSDSRQRGAVATRETMQKF